MGIKGWYPGETEEEKLAGLYMSSECVRVRVCVCLAQVLSIVHAYWKRREKKKNNVIWKGLRFNCDDVNCDFSLACSYLLKLINANAETEVSWFILLRCGRVWGHDGRCICIVSPLSFCLSLCRCHRCRIHMEENYSDVYGLCLVLRLSYFMCQALE